MSKLTDEQSTPATVASFQRAINKRGRSRGVSLIIDGEYGPKTIQAERSVAHRLGVARVDGSIARALHRQNIIRHPGKRTPAEVARGGRVVRAWRKKLKSQGTMGERAWKIAGTLVGTMEQGGNNRGPMVEKIIRDNGGDVGEPWCGDFVAYCYRQAGSKAVNRSWASVYYLGRIVGVTKTSDPKVGDLVRYTFSHTGLFGKWNSRPVSIRTREGNTGASGAVSDGNGHDGVYEKNRTTGQVEDYRKVTR
jgi:hypothetical protein